MDIPIKKPYGLRFLRVISYIGLVFLLLGTLALPSAFANSTPLLISIAILTLVISLAEEVSTIVAINKPRLLLYKIVLSLFVINTVFPIIASLITDTFVWYTDVVFALPSIFFIWYLQKVRGYFADPTFNSEDETIKAADKKVNVFFISWIIVVLLVGIVNAGVEARKALDKLNQFSGKTFQENVDSCSTLPQDEKEECIITLLAHSIDSNQPIDQNVCNLITNDQRKVSCYALINRCDLIIDEQTKAICTTVEEIINFSTSSTTPSE